MQDPASLPKSQILALLMARDEELMSREVDLAMERKEVGKSERYIKDPDQLRIDFGDTDEAADAAEGLADAVDEADLADEPPVPPVPPKRRQPRKKRDESLPAHLPRRVTIVPPAPQDMHCAIHGEKQLLPEAWKAISTTLRSQPKSSRTSTLITCRFTGNKNCSQAAAGHRPAAPC